MIIKLISLNVWVGGNLWEKAMDFLRKEDPDILVMQEIYNGKNQLLEKRFRSFIEIKKTLNFHFASFSPAFLDTRTIGDIDRGNAVFSKFPIIKNLTIHYDLPYGAYDEEHNFDYENVPMCLQHTIIRIGSNDFDIYNLQGVWGKDGKDNERRLHMGDVLVRETQNKKRVILAGDFNVNPDTTAIQKIENRLKNVFRNSLTTTFNQKQKNNPALLQSVVDMIFVSYDIKIIDFSCPHVDISDHFPLICHLDI